MAGPRQLHMGDVKYLCQLWIYFFTQGPSFEVSLAVVMQ